MYQVKSTAIIYGIIHFLVDFCCAFFMFSISGRLEDFYIGFLIYNFLAFAMQMPIGLLADKIKKNADTAGIGCLLVLTALILMNVEVPLGKQAVLWSGLFFAGIGNCLFHVGGGIDVMKKSGDKAAPLGIFVSPGAIGIFWGTMLGKQKMQIQIILICLLAITAGLLFMNRKEKQIINNAGFTGQKESKQRGKFSVSCMSIVALICFFLVVAIRSYLGMTIVFPWKDTMADGLLVLAAIFGGKLAGGFLADWCGVKRAGLCTLLLAAVMFGFSEYMAAGILALFLFQMSMPITLYLAAKLLPGQNGFAFGILTFAIFMGFLPVYAGYQACSSMMLVILTMVSALTLWAGAVLYEKGNSGIENDGNGRF